MKPDEGQVLLSKNRRLSVVDHRLTSDIVKFRHNSETKIVKIGKIVTSQTVAKITATGNAFAIDKPCQGSQAQDVSSCCKSSKSHENAVL